MSDRSQPNQVLLLHQVTVDLIELGGQRPGVGQPFGARLDGPARFKILQDDGRVSRGNGIGGNVLDHHGTGADDAVCADPDPLADDRTVADPDIVLDMNRKRSVR